MARGCCDGISHSLAALESGNVVFGHHTTTLPQCHLTSWGLQPDPSSAVCESLHTGKPRDY